MGNREAVEGNGGRTGDGRQQIAGELIDAGAQRDRIERFAIDQRHADLRGLPLHGGGEKPRAIPEPLVERLFGARRTACDGSHSQAIAFLDQKVESRCQHCLLPRREGI
jgi:hypothetical protein